MFEAPSEDQLAELKAKHGNDMRVVEVEDMTFVLALPDDDKKVATEFKRFVDLYDSGKKKEAFGSLFPAYCVYPEKEVVERVLRRRPGFQLVLGQCAAELLGVQATSVKKG